MKELFIVGFGLLAYVFGLLGYLVVILLPEALLILLLYYLLFM